MGRKNTHFHKNFGLPISLFVFFFFSNIFSAFLTKNSAICFVMSFVCQSVSLSVCPQFRYLRQTSVQRLLGFFAIDLHRFVNFGIYRNKTTFLARKSPWQRKCNFQGKNSYADRFFFTEAVSPLATLNST